MSRYRLTEQARADLDEIWLYIAEDNIPAADRFLDTLHDPKPPGREYGGVQWTPRRSCLRLKESLRRNFY
jgi:plasmid stabilization system protein ParE